MELPMQTTTTQLDIDRLRADVRGTVITPDDPTYDAARTIVPGDVLLEDADEVEIRPVISGGAA